MKLPDPVILTHDGFQVVRDDLLAGGTKRRAIHVLLGHHEEYVYASPVYGYAQLALTYAARDFGKRSTIFCAKRQELHPLTHEVIEAGGKVVEVPHGYLNVVKARAREYCQATGAKLLPFGLDTPEFVEALAQVARDLHIDPFEVWTVTGSGVLSRALQLAWPNASFYGVQVGAWPEAGKASIIRAEEPYEKDARERPPFPSCGNYDAKVWRLMKKYGTPGALFWNVGR